MKESNKIIHGLWIGNELSAIEQLCIQSFIQNGHIFTLWSYAVIKNIPKGTILENASDIIPHNEIFSYIHTNKYGHGKGSYAGFSDIFRYKLLYEKGGWWTDMDVTCLKPFDFEDDYVFRKNGNKGVVGNILKCPKNNDLMKYCYENAHQQINENNKDWMLPIKILNSGIKQFKLEQYILDFTNEDSWPVIIKLLATGNNLNSSFYAIHWMNEEWRRHGLKKDAFIEQSSIQQLLEKHTIDHHFLSEKEEKQFHFSLSKWNYRIINLKARIRWLWSGFIGKE